MIKKNGEVITQKERSTCNLHSNIRRCGHDYEKKNQIKNVINDKRFHLL